jgi:hypothetical protein
MQASILRHNVYRRSLCDRATDRRLSEPSAQRTGEHDSSYGGERATYIALDTSSIEGMRDRPPRRAAQGDGAAVVLRARESRVHGEGRQVSAAQGQGGRRDAERHNCSGASRATGSQALERRMRRKVHVRCGELRHEVACVLVVPDRKTRRQPVVLSADPTRTCGRSNPVVRSSWNNVASPVRVASDPQGEDATASVRAVGS